MTYVALSAAKGLLSLEPVTPIAGQLSPLTLLRRRRSPGPVAGMSLWLKADAGVLNGSGNPASDGDAIATWQDQSGNGNDATQASTAALVRPGYRSGILNGRPVVGFNGTSWVATVDFGLAFPVSIFSVFRYTGPNSGNYTIFDGSHVNTMRLFRVTDAFLMYSQGAGASVAAPVGPWALHETLFTRDGRDARYRLNGGTPVAGTAWGSAVPGAVTIGADGYVDYAGVEAARFDLAEMVIYPSALSDADRTAVEAYLNAKYAIY